MGCWGPYQTPECDAHCQVNCEDNLENCAEYCQWCESYCQNNCEKDCQKSCQDHCEKYCQSTCETSCQSTAQTNRPPNTPSRISVPSEVKAGENLKVSWTKATDPDGDVPTYRLQRSVDNGAWSNVYTGANLSFSDSVPRCKTLRYRVRAEDSYTSSGYTTSSIITVITNTDPVISGRDEDLGGKTGPFTIPYSVTDEDEGDSVRVVESLNNTVLRTINNVNLGTGYYVDITQELFDNLDLNTQNTVTIQATDSNNATTYRRYRFRRVNTAPSITVAKTNLGEQNKPFDVVFSVDDKEKDKVDVEVSLGSKVLKSYKDVTLGQDYTLKIDRLEYAKLRNGTHRVRIKATDVHGAVSTRDINFSKAVYGCGYLLKRDTNTNAVQTVVDCNLELAKGAKLTVEVCNNANDSNPTWETVEKAGVLHKFENTKKTASKWAIGVRVDVSRPKDKGVGESYLYGVAVSYR